MLIALKRYEFLNFPVVSEMCLYNGTNNKNISPTPVIGGAGLISKYNRKINHQFTNEKNCILVVGKTLDI